VRDLSAACAELSDQLAIFGDPEITTDRADGGLPTIGWMVVDQDVEPGPGRGGVPATRTPGNTAALNAQLDAHEMVRRLEAALRLAIAGHTGRARGGSDRNTKAALKAIQNLGAALPQEVRDSRGKLVWPCQELAARVVERAASVIGQLPAVDEVPKWTKIRPGPGGLPPRCPNCETYSLRVALASGVVVCVYPDCEDLDGRRPPQARMDLSKIDGRPVLVWRDGLVQLSEDRLPVFGVIPSCCGELPACAASSGAVEEPVPVAMVTILDRVVRVTPLFGYNFPTVGTEPDLEGEPPQYPVRFTERHALRFTVSAGHAGGPASAHALSGRPSASAHGLSGRRSVASPSGPA